MKVTVRHRKRRGCWECDYRPPGQGRKRPTFETRKLAEAHAATVRSQHEHTGGVWLGMSAAERGEVLRVVEEARTAGVRLETVWRGYQEWAASQVGPSKRLGEAYGVFIGEKKAQLLAPKSLLWYESGIGNFIKGREEVLVKDVTRDDVQKWLGNPAWSPRTFNARRWCLHIFFKWCRNLAYLADLPTATIAPIEQRRMADIDEPPAILVPEQVARLLRATREVDPGLIPYVSTCLFGGLRPEKEAGRLTQAEVQRDHIVVLGKNAKDRQRRHVRIHPTLRAWLNLRGEYATRREDGTLKPIRNLRKRFEDVRGAANLIHIEIRHAPKQPGRPGPPARLRLDNGQWRQVVNTGWAQDCLRHTFASHWLPIFGAESTVAQLGHGDYDMLFRHYRALVTRAQARSFWRLTPKRVRRMRQPLPASR